MATRRTAYDEKRDQHVANSAGPDPELMCSADGCPNRWSIDSSDKGIYRCCSAHAWVERHEWPLVTQQQQWDEVERARLRGELEFNRSKVTQAPLTKAQKLEKLTELRDLMAGVRVRPPETRIE